jgi:polysaccharide chain length determinant protein (PEP-CTERM system associated)
VNTSLGINLSGILQILYRRKGLIIAVFCVVFSLAAYLAVSLPSVYRSSTLILITPQRLPPSYVNTTVTWSIEQRMMTIIQQILGRTSLEKIVQEFNLFSSSNQEITMEERVERLRKKIKINTRRNDTFELSFDAESPEKAMRVTDRLASLFIAENLRVREQQAVGTTTFMNAEANRLRIELEEQEAQVNRYRALYRFELPEQLDANLRTLEQLRTELQANALRLSSLQERKASLETQLVEAKFMVLDGGRSSEGQQGVPAWKSLENRKLQLEELRTRYSDKHPDVVRLRKEIQSLEGEAEIQQSQTKGSSSTEASPVRNPVQQTLLKQVADLDSEINSLQSTNELLRGRIASYQARVDNAPVRAIELSKISRAYDITVKKYQDLEGKSLDSLLSENMEKNQKGEQFQVVDPANFPQKPAMPNRQRIFLLGLLLGLGGGVGAALLLENLNTSFKKNEDLDGYINVPLLAVLPTVATRGRVLEQRRALGMLAVASVGALAVGLVLIRLFGSSLTVF